MTGQHLRDLPVFLRAPRSAALWLIGVLITVASVVAFVLSYHGLFDWALHHQWPAPLAVWFPFLVDLLIVVAEVILFVAAIDGRTPWRVRALAWAVLLAFTGLSVAGNATHSARADAMTRAGFALPPLVLAVALGFGLGELKRQAAKYRDHPDSAAGRVPVAVPVPTVREIRERRKCSQATAQKIRAELKLLTRNPPAAVTHPPGAAAGDGGRDGTGAFPVPAAPNGNGTQRRGDRHA